MVMVPDMDDSRLGPKIGKLIEEPPAGRPVEEMFSAMIHHKVQQELQKNEDRLRVSLCRLWLKTKGCCCLQKIFL
jgi:hypothetical protein